MYIKLADNLPLNEVVNQIYDISDLYSSIGRELQKRVSEIADIDRKEVKKCYLQ